MVCTYICIRKKRVYYRCGRTLHAMGSCERTVQLYGNTVIQQRRFAQKACFKARPKTQFEKSGCFVHETSLLNSSSHFCFSFFFKLSQVWKLENSHTASWKNGNEREQSCSPGIPLFGHLNLNTNRRRTGGIRSRTIKHQAQRSQVHFEVAYLLQCDTLAVWWGVWLMWREICSDTMTFPIRVLRRSFNVSWDVCTSRETPIWRVIPLLSANVTFLWYCFVLQSLNRSAYNVLVYHHRHSYEHHHHFICSPRRLHVRSPYSIFSFN